MFELFFSGRNGRFGPIILTAGQFGVHLVREMVQSSIVYWIGQTLAQFPLMNYNIQYVIRFIKKKNMYQIYISVKTEIQIYQHMGCDLDLPL